MTCIVAYDIEDNRTRNQMARYLLTLGIRMQKSVFAVKIERHSFGRLQKKLAGLADGKGKVAVIRLCEGCKRQAMQFGEESSLYYVF
ncbi:MAG: CRISPR-associated endonuclease Cas2 [Desulfobulbus sp.]|jgi:CRISPR-associated endonuclease Cas2|nr:MAG: CRISPR-associated endonuclease Cas2 [Desulfobulbus sp.]